MFKKPPPDVSLDKALDRVLLDMQNHSVVSTEYAKMVDQLSKLHALKVANTKMRVSNDTMATIVANLAGIVLILHFEKVQIVTSKAMSFVPKLR